MHGQGYDASAYHDFAPPTNAYHRRPPQHHDARYHARPPHGPPADAFNDYGGGYGGGGGYARAAS